MLRDFLREKTIALKSSVVQCDDGRNSSSHFEIKSKLIRISENFDGGVGKSTLDQHVLCSWSVKKNIVDFQRCLKDFQTLSAGGNEKWKHFAKEFHNFTFLKEGGSPLKRSIGKYFAGEVDVAKVQQFVACLEKSRKLPPFAESFLTDHMYNYESTDPLFLGISASSYKQQSDAIRSIIFSAYIAVALCVVILLFYFINFIIFLRMPYLRLFDILWSLAILFRLSYFFLAFAIKTLIFFGGIAVLFHRVLGYSVGWYIRTLMGCPEGGGKFDIHIGWIGLRLGLDKNQIIVSGFTWKNGPAFKASPFFVSIKEVAITISTEFIIRTLWARKVEDSIVIDEVAVDGVHVYIEKTSKKEEGLNLFAALGMESPEEEENVQKGFFAILSQAVNSTTGVLSNTASSAVNLTAGVGRMAATATKEVGLTAINATAAVGSTAVNATTDAGKMMLSTSKDIGSSLISGAVGATSFLGISKSKSDSPGDRRPTLQKQTGIIFDESLAEAAKDARKDIRGGEEEDEDDNDGESIWREVDDAPTAVKTEITLEVNRVLLMDLNVHVSYHQNES